MQEIEGFINSLTSEQFEKITEYIQNLPSMKYTDTFDCEKCNTNNEFKLEGMQDFFS